MKVKQCINCDSADLTKVNERIDNNPIMECGNCQMLMVGELNDDTESLYTADYFQKDKSTKFGYADYLSSPVANIVGKFGLSALFVPSGAHLDLGAADGSLMEVFAAHGYTTRGLEISRDAVAIAGEKGLEMSYSNLKGFPKGQPKSDVITAFDLLEHSDAPLRVMQEVHNNLNPNGYFVFSTLSVDKNDSEDFWFNNSLEHYAYFTDENLRSALESVFGKDKVVFKEVENNGIAEFWGFAKKGKVGAERALIEDLGTPKVLKALNPDTAYYMSLFYNQVSLFEQSLAIINKFSKQWSESLRAEAEFYNFYYQGQFENALLVADRVAHVMPASRAVYWQALTDVRQKMEALRLEQTIRSFDPLKEKLNKTQHDLSDMSNRYAKASLQVNDYQNSRYIGPVIKLRDKKSGATSKLHHVKHGVYHNIKKVLPQNVVDDIIAKRNPPKEVNWVENTAHKAGDPLISIITPYFKNKDTVDQTLQSLKDQSFKDFEVILIEDGSPEAAIDKKMKQLEKYPLNMTIIRQKNQGVAMARNNGIKKAKGRYLVALDSDDILTPLYLEKCLAILEAEADTDIVPTHVQNFGLNEDTRDLLPYNPKLLFDNNFVITASMFRKKAWDDSPGYQSGIGYEDWEFWLSLAERGHWARLLPERLFRYRVAEESRFLEDREQHAENRKKIKALHPNFQSNVNAELKRRGNFIQRTTDSSVMLNMNRAEQYDQSDKRPKLLITMPWMTFGGAETLVINYADALKEDYDITFMTGQQHPNEWEWRFAAISPKIYHLANLYESKEHQLEFVSNYIATRGIQVLQIVHNSFMLPMLPELKKRHPELKVLVTMFNDTAGHFALSLTVKEQIDLISSDNKAVLRSYENALDGYKIPMNPIANGVEVVERYLPNPNARTVMRNKLGIKEGQIAAFFIGRMSPEKNPQAVLDVIETAHKKKTLKNTKFFFIGDGPQADIVKKAAEQYGEEVQYLGYKDNVADYLQAADVFILPSLVEGFPQSIVEALAMGVAPVASKVGAIPDVITSWKNGVVIKEPGSVQQIYKALTKIEKNPDLLADMKKQARKDAKQKYSIQVMTQHYHEMFDRLIK